MTGPPAAPDIGRIEVEPGLELRVERWGPRSGARPLILVHGFMGSAAAWGNCPPDWPAAGPVIVPDLPGHGGSDGPLDPQRYAVPRVAAMLGRLARALGAGDADWLGYSMGGRIVLAGVGEGVLTPRRLILESTSPGLEREADRAARREVDGVRAARLRADGIAPFVDAWLEMPLFATQTRLPAEVRAAERARRLAADPAALAACLDGGGTGTQPSYWSALPDLDVPVLLLTGADDARFCALSEAMATGLPRGRRLVVPDAGHAVHLEAPGPWIEAVEGFLDRSGA